MEPVRFNLTTEDVRTRIAQALARPKTERRPLTQVERDSLTELNLIQKVFNEQTMDHVAE